MYASASCVRAMVAPTMSYKKQLDWNYDWVVPGKLIQGGFPNPAIEAFSVIDTLVLCAEEKQPRLKPPPGKAVIRIPLDDDPYRPLPKEFAEAVRSVGAELANQIRSGRTVASTCAMGVNRSGLVSAFTLMSLYNMTGGQAIELIRRNRRAPEEGMTPLCNPMFEQHVRNARR